MAKRLFDILFSTVGLLFLLPFLPLFAWFIKQSSPGPLFYASKRYGKNRKVINCWKFRTMYVDADSKLEKIFLERPDLYQEWKIFRKIKEDPRSFPFGKVLRSYSLDELPQLWNVLRGDLSLVGPRAYLTDEIDQLPEKQAAALLSTRPGITGLWQVSGRNLLTFAERVRLEEEYVQKQSFLFDLKLLAKTIPALLSSKGAY